MSRLSVYDLRWASVRLGDIDSSVPAGSGVYIIVLDSTERGYVAFYVGKSTTLRRRARAHVRNWFTEPHANYWIPEDADAFLNDPIAVFNANAVALGLPERQQTQRRVRERCLLCFATLDPATHRHGPEHLEYVLQEALKLHVGIEIPGHIGDSGMRHPPSTDLTINNIFEESFLGATLPTMIEFTASRLKLT